MDLTAEAIQRAAEGTPFGARLVYRVTTESTMNDAAALAASGEPHGTIVLAEEQTAGRGRFGRAWYSERGAGLYFSMILRPPLPAAAAPMLTLAAGLAVREAASQVTGLDADIRWPNDVLLGGKKCAGILLELTAEPERIKWVILGIGINVNQSVLPAELAGEATSLRIAVAAGDAVAAGGRATAGDALDANAATASGALGRIASGDGVLDREAVLSAVLHALDHSLARLLAPGGRAATVAEFSRCSTFARGRRVQVEEGGEVVAGVTDGLDAAGYLLLRRDDNGAVEPIYTGRLRPLDQNMR